MSDILKKEIKAINVVFTDDRYPTFEFTLSDGLNVLNLKLEDGNSEDRDIINLYVKDMVEEDFIKTDKEDFLVYKGKLEGLHGFTVFKAKNSTDGKIPLNGVYNNLAFYRLHHSVVLGDYLVSFVDQWNGALSFLFNSKKEITKDS